MLNLIIAVDNNLGIGYKNDLLFKDSIDLQRFKSITLNNIVAMGRNTYESIPFPLQGRKEIVIGKLKREFPKVPYLSSFTKSTILTLSDKEEVFVIGGKTLIESIDVTKFDEIHITYFQENKKADTHISESYAFPYRTHYISHSETILDTKHPHTYIIWKRKSINKMNP